MNRDRAFVIGEIVRNDPDGGLLLTPSTESLSNGVPINVDLKCSESSSQEDIKAIEVAQKAALERNLDFINILDSKIDTRSPPKLIDSKALKKELSALLHLAPKDVGASLMMASGSASNASLVCELLENAKNNETAEENTADFFTSLTTIALLAGPFISYAAETMEGGALLQSSLDTTLLAAMTADSWRLKLNAKQRAELARFSNPEITEAAWKNYAILKDKAIEKLIYTAFGLTRLAALYQGKKDAFAEMQRDLEAEEKAFEDEKKTERITNDLASKDPELKNTKSRLDQIKKELESISKNSGEISADKRGRLKYLEKKLASIIKLREDKITQEVNISANLPRPSNLPQTPFTGTTEQLPTKQAPASPGWTNLDSDINKITNGAKTTKIALLSTTGAQTNGVASPGPIDKITERTTYIKELKDRPDLNKEFKNMGQQELKELISTQKLKAFVTLAAGVNQPFVYEFTNGLVGVFKPDPSVTDRIKAYQNFHLGSAINEAVACSTDELFGLNLIPKTVVTTINGKKGSLMLFEPSAITGNQNKINNAAGKIILIADHQKVKLDLLDYLIENSDRHNRNYMVTSEGKLIAIDNGLSFWQGEAFGARRNSAYGFSIKERPQHKTPELFWADNFSNNRGFNAASDSKSITEFVRSSDGLEFIEKLKSYNADSIKDALKQKLPELTEKELIVFSTRINRSREHLLLYLEKF